MLISRTLRLSCLAALVLAATSARVEAQTATYAADSGDGSRELVTVDTLSGALLESRAGLSFLEPSPAGRTRVDRLRADLPNLRGGGSPAPGLRLPQDGTLYLVEQAGQRELLKIDGFGLPTTLLDDGAAGGQLAAAMAVADSGETALLATDTGRFWLVDTAGVLPARELTPLGGVTLADPSSLRLGTARAWMVADGLVFRVDLTQPTARLQALTHALDPGETILPELAMSRDGNTVAGVSALLGGGRHLYVAQQTGGLQRLSAVPGDFDPPSLDNPGGPLLALAPDGGCIAWRNTVIVKELFTQRLDVPAPPEQLTADSQFADTFDSGTILDFTVEGQLVFMVGESALGDPYTAIGAAEVFRVDTNAPGMPISNLSQTSGQLSAPFLAPGQLEIKDLVRTSSGDRVLITVDPDGGDSQLLSLDLTQPGALTPLTQPSDFGSQLVPANDSLLVVEPSQPGLPGRLLQVRAGLPHVLLSAIPVGVTLGRFAEDRFGRRAAFVASLGGGQELPVYVDLIGSKLALAWSLLVPLSEGLAFTRDGKLALGVGNPARHGLIAPGSAPVLAQVPFGPAVPLAP